MRIPLDWLQKYIKLEHSLEEFGGIMTGLEFMQDGPVDTSHQQPVIDLEVRQNRPDALSMIGIAREYAAFINKHITEPEQFEQNTLDVKWGDPDTNLKVIDKEVVKRFCTATIENIKMKDSPDWLKSDLESYGIPSHNLVVDITNYVMLEYGIPLHAFDIDKLDKDDHSSLLTLRMAEVGESFTTWQNTQIKLSAKDLVVADASKPIAIAGIIGGANSDIDNSTKQIILEAACYSHSAIRKTSIKNNIRTEASTRHEKFLNPDMVEKAILRAIWLITNLSDGNLTKIEDYYPTKGQNSSSIEFNIKEVERLGSVMIESTDIIHLLNRLGFSIIEHNESIGLDQNILIVKIPAWRTDIKFEADLVEEVLRLWGYENIPLIELSSTIPDYSTSNSLLLEDKIKDILVELGLYEQYLSPFVKYNHQLVNQIKMENAKNLEADALRTTIRESLEPVIDRYSKSGKSDFGVFESGKVYFKLREGEYSEEKRIGVTYHKSSFESKVKSNFLAILMKLGIGDNVNWKKTNNHIEYYLDNIIIASLYHDGYELYLDNISSEVNAYSVPSMRFKTSLTQKIVENISLLIPENESIGKIADHIKNMNEYIKSIDIMDIFKLDNQKSSQKSITLTVLFEDIKNQLNRENIEEIKEEILQSIKSKFGATLRK